MPMRCRMRAAVAAGLLLVGAFFCGSACSREQVSGSRSRVDTVAPAPRFAVSTAAPVFLVGLATGARDQQGDPISIRCATCHDMLTPAAALPADVSRVAGPHLGLRFQHGELRCGSCHDAAVVHTLRLADGRNLAMQDAIDLCSQCHGPQARDYRHGAHGGMHGYWDLSRGPRERNTCVSCHDPHVPVYPKYLPAPPPNDRFAQGARHHD